MSEIICLHRHMALDRSPVYFVLPDFEVIERQVEQGAEPDGHFIGDKRKVKATLFNLSGTSFLYDGRRLYEINSSKTRCYFYSIFGLQLFMLSFEDQFCVVRLVATKPMLIRGILDPTYDMIDAAFEDFWYGVYCRWWGGFRRSPAP